MELLSKIHFVSDDKELNDILRSRKGTNFSVLYVSLWDQWSEKIVQAALDGEAALKTALYIVDSWDIPQSFATFNISSAPALVHFRKGEVLVDVEYPKVYEFFQPLLD